MTKYLRYMNAAMKRAELEWVEEDEQYYAHIPGLIGLWASGKTKKAVRKDLCSALDGWLCVNFWVARAKLPTFAGIDLADEDIFLSSGGITDRDIEKTKALATKYGWR
jgi:predicted RNase H-like HicB family nuclease